MTLRRPSEPGCSHDAEAGNLDEIVRALRAIGGGGLGSEAAPLWIVGVPHDVVVDSFAQAFPVARVVDRPDRFQESDVLVQVGDGWCALPIDRVDAERQSAGLVFDAQPGRNWSVSERSILQRAFARSLSGVVVTAVDESYESEVAPGALDPTGSEARPLDLRELRLAFTKWGPVGELFFRPPLAKTPTLRARFAPPAVQQLRHWWSLTRAQVDRASLEIRDDGGPSIVIATPVHNGARYLEEALISIRDQLHSNFRWLIFDDASTDDSPSVIAKVVGRDPRVRIVRSTERLGLQGAWREAFHRAVGFVCEETGEAPRYFAWTSDHDVWNCDWLRTLVPILERHRSAVLAHSWVETIDESGRMQPGPIPIFETEQQHSVPHRIVHSIRAMNGAGNAVYGLFRVEALTQCGVFREVLMPDRLLLTELALEGRVIQHPQVLWLRRATGTFSLRRQRARLFREGGRPWSTLLPWWIVHGAILGRELHRGGATWPASIGVSIRFGIVQGLKSCKQTLLGLLRKAPRR